MFFLGIDLGWQSGASGLCCLSWDGEVLRLVDLQLQQPLTAIFAWVDSWSAKSSDVVVAVDAPTLIPNETGMRLPDRLAHKYFGKYDAGCYPANRGRPFAQRLIGFGLALEERGFRHCPHSPAQPQGRYQLEVFPHPVTVHLFRLNRILKYKKGRIGERRAELDKLRQYQLRVLPKLTPCLQLLSNELPSVPSGGSALKAVEDQLDSITCAYAAAYWWYWGTERNWILGDELTGYIVVPAPLETPDN